MSASASEGIENGLMPRQRQDDECGKDEGEGEAADKQDQAEAKGLGPRFDRGPHRSPLLRRLRRHADQHCHRRRSDRPLGRIVTGRCYVHGAGDTFFHRRGGVFLMMRRLPLLGAGGPSRSKACSIALC
jgi:hypothetical protein